MARISKAKLDALRKVDSGMVLSAANGKHYWRGSLEELPKVADVKALVQQGYLGLVNELSHAVGTGQLFYVTEKGMELIAPEPEPEDDEGDVE